MTRMWFYTFCLGLILLANSAKAEDKPPVDEKPIISETGDSLSLSIRDAVEKTLRNNVAITVQSFTPKIKEQNITNKEAQFDPTAYGSITPSKVKQQVSSVFAQPNVSVNENLNTTLGLKQTVATGGNYVLEWDSLRAGTNSLYAPLIPNYTSQINLTLTQPLLKNFGVDINIAKNDFAASEFDFKTQVINIITNAKNNYWDLYYSIENLRVAEKSLERARDLEKITRAQVSVGTLAPLEIISAQAEAAAREEAVIAAKKLIKDNEDTLKNAMNIQLDSPEGQKQINTTDRPLYVVKDKPVLDSALKEAFENRPDYQSMKKNLESKNIIVKFNKNQLYPELDLMASAGVNGMAGTPKSVLFNGNVVQSPWQGNYVDSLGNTFSRDYYQWSVGLSVTYPLGNRAAESQLTASKLDAEQSLLNLKDLEKTIVVAVREAVRLLDSTAKNVEATRVARKLADERLKAEEKKFKVGLSTPFNVLQLQENLATQEALEIQAVVDYNKAQDKLKLVLGRTLESNNIVLSTRTMQ